MRVGAIVKDLGIPPRKVRLVVDMVRGKKVEDAINILKFTPTPAAKAVAKAIKSASANAENNFQMDPAELKVVYIAADEARTLKRYRPQSRGRYSPILKRATHIKVLVSEEEK
ncbi:MAG: 50S ribosomal protein L22 [Dehalococcoidia bacterium]|jgi:large subunit ribosomal protein L22